MIDSKQKGKTGYSPSSLVTHDGLFTVDLQQQITFWSESAQRILALQPEEVIGRPCYEVLAGRDTRNHRFCRPNCPVMVNARRGRPTPDYDILCTTAKGEDKWFNVSVVVPRSRDGERAVIHMFRDVTRRRRMEEFAGKASTALRQLLQEGNGHVANEGPDRFPPPSKLSRRELDVLRLLATGMATGEIAETLAIRPVTARNHVNRLLLKLGVANRLQAVVYASQHRLI